MEDSTRDSSVELLSVLDAKRDSVLQVASQALQRAHLSHYEASGSAASDRRLSDLFGLVVACLAQRSLVPICDYSERVAKERFGAGFEIGEVQTAFNVLEESIWQVVISSLPASVLVEGAGLIGTVLGAGKDTLARTWVSLATTEHVPSLDLGALFEGTAS